MATYEEATFNHEAVYYEPEECLTLPPEGCNATSYNSAVTRQLDTYAIPVPVSLAPDNREPLAKGIVCSNLSGESIGVAAYIVDSLNQSAIPPQEFDHNLIRPDEIIAYGESEFYTLASECFTLDVFGSYGDYPIVKGYSIADLRGQRVIVTTASEQPSVCVSNNAADTCSEYVLIRNDMSIDLCVDINQLFPFKNKSKTVARVKKTLCDSPQAPLLRLKLSAGAYEYFKIPTAQVEFVIMKVPQKDGNSDSSVTKRRRPANTASRYQVLHQQKVTLGNTISVFKRRQSTGVTTQVNPSNSTVWIQKSEVQQDGELDG